MVRIGAGGEDCIGLVGSFDTYDSGSAGSYWFSTFMVETIYTMPVVTSTVRNSPYHSAPWGPVI